MLVLLPPEQTDRAWRDRA